MKTAIVAFMIALVLSGIVWSAMPMPVPPPYDPIAAHKDVLPVQRPPAPLGRRELYLQAKDRYILAKDLYGKNDPKTRALHEEMLAAKRAYKEERRLPKESPRRSASPDPEPTYPHLQPGAHW